MNAADFKYVTGFDIDEDHPHGDLDRIDLDLEIMPNRSGVTGTVDAFGNPIQRKNIIAGIDVAYCMEAVSERKNWWNFRDVGFATEPREGESEPYWRVNNDGKYVDNVFRRRISTAIGQTHFSGGSSINDMLSGMKTMFPVRVGERGEYANTFEPPFSTIVIPDNDQVLSMDDVIANNLIDSVRYEDYTAPLRLSYGDGLLRANVELAFDSLSKLNYQFFVLPCPSYEYPEIGSQNPKGIRVYGFRYSGSDVYDPPSPSVSSIGYRSQNSFNWTKEGYEWSWFTTWSESVPPYVFDFGKVSPEWIKFYHVAKWREWEWCFTADSGHPTGLLRNNFWWVLKEIPMLPTTDSLAIDVAKACNVSLKQYLPPKQESGHASCAYEFQTNDSRIVAIAKFGNHTRWQN